MNGSRCTLKLQVPHIYSSPAYTLFLSPSRITFLTHAHVPRGSPASVPLYFLRVFLTLFFCCPFSATRYNATHVAFSHNAFQECHKGRIGISKIGGHV